MMPPDATRPTIGVIVLQADEVIEQDLRRLFRADDAAIHVSRVPSGADLTPETIAAMEAALPDAVGLFPRSLPFDAIGYACTSGAALIGQAKIDQLVRQAASVREVTDPLSAALRAFDRLGASRIGLVSPYIAEVSSVLCEALGRHGHETPVVVSFDERQEALVARIDPGRIRDAAIRVGSSPEVDRVFLSCTNLRTLGAIDEIERELAKPVVSSSQALAWHLARLSRAGPLGAGYGRLMGLD